MKLYSRSQLITVTAIGMIATAIFVSTLTAASTRKKLNDSNEKNISKEIPSSEDKKTFTLLQSEEKKDSTITVASGEINYTQENQRLKQWKMMMS